MARVWWASQLGRGTAIRCVLFFLSAISVLVLGGRVALLSGNREVPWEQWLPVIVAMLVFAPLAGALGAEDGIIKLGRDLERIRNGEQRASARLDLRAAGWMVWVPAAFAIMGLAVAVASMTFLYLHGPVTWVDQDEKGHLCSGLALAAMFSPSVIVAMETRRLRRWIAECLVLGRLSDDVSLWNDGPPTAGRPAWAAVRRMRWLCRGLLALAVLIGAGWLLYSAVVARQWHGVVDWVVVGVPAWAAGVALAWSASLGWVLRVLDRAAALRAELASRADGSPRG